MEQWFDTFNQTYFQGALPQPALQLSQSRTRLGTLSYRRVRTWKGMKNESYTLRLSNYYDLSEREYQNTLLHEMIHYVIAYKGWKDTSAHGQIFRNMMRELNTKYGWEINISAKQSEVGEPATNRPLQERLILALELQTGERMLSAINPGYALMFEKQLATIREVKTFLWLRTFDDYFRDFPVVRSLRGRKVSVDEYNRIIQSATTASHVRDLFDG